MIAVQQSPLTAQKMAIIFSIYSVMGGIFSSFLLMAISI